MNIVQSFSVWKELYFHRRLVLPLYLCQVSLTDWYSPALSSPVQTVTNINQVLFVFYLKWPGWGVGVWGGTMDWYKKLGSGLPEKADQLENGMRTFISSSALAEHRPKQIKYWQIGTDLNNNLESMTIFWRNTRVADDLTNRLSEYPVPQLQIINDYF